MLRTPIDRSFFFSQYRRAFGALEQTQVNGLSLLLSFIESDRDLAINHRYVAYFLASVKHETADTWRPIREHGDSDYFVRRYWTNERVRRWLGNLTPEDALTYHGRGYLQITGRNHYRTFGALFDVPLLGDPDLALDPALSYRIASLGVRHGKFTGKPLRLYIGINHCDYLGARKVINGRDRQELIAGYAESIEEMLRQTGG